MITRKTTFLFIILIAGLCLFVNGQCEKKLKLKTEKVYQLKAENTAGEEILITAEITLSKDSIFVLMNWGNANVTEVRGRHTATVCKMNKEYSDGTIDFKTDAEMIAHGETKKARMLFNVISKAGKMKVYGVPEDDNEKLCFVIRDREEIK
jgi:hypothetical protein